METPNRTYIILDNIVSNAESIQYLSYNIVALWVCFIVLAIKRRKK